MSVNVCVYWRWIMDGASTKRNDIIAAHFLSFLSFQNTCWLGDNIENTIKPGDDMIFYINRIYLCSTCIFLLVAVQQSWFSYILFSIIFPFAPDAQRNSHHFYIFLHCHRKLQHISFEMSHWERRCLMCTVFIESMYTYIIDICHIYIIYYPRAYK